MNQTRTLPDRWRSRNDHDGRVWNEAEVLDGAVHSGAWFYENSRVFRLLIGLKRGFRRLDIDRREPLRSKFTNVASPLQVFPQAAPLSGTGSPRGRLRPGRPPGSGRWQRGEAAV